MTPTPTFTATPSPLPSPTPVLTPITANDVYNQTAQAFTSLGALQTAVSNALSTINVLLWFIGIAVAIATTVGVLWYKWAIDNSIKRTRDEISGLATAEIERVTTEAEARLLKQTEDFESRFSQLENQSIKRFEELIESLVKDASNKEAIEKQLNELISSMKEDVSARAEASKAEAVARASLYFSGPGTTNYQQYKANLSKYQNLLTMKLSGRWSPGHETIAVDLRNRLNEFARNNPELVKGEENLYRVGGSNDVQMISEGDD